jgi:hypothetical protein
VIIFEGTITDPGISIGTSDAMRKVSCRGNMDGGAANEAVRVLFADSDTSNWLRPSKTPKHDFAVDQTSQATGDGQLVAQAKWGSTYAADAWGDICYRLYNGIPTQDKISGVYAHYRWNADLYAAGDYNAPGSPGELISGMIPNHNLFADPRGLAAGNPWQANKHQANEHYAKWTTGWVDLQFPEGSSMGAAAFQWKDDGTASGGQGAMANATVVGGAVTAIYVTNGGSGYTSAPDVVISSYPPYYSGAAATCTVTDGAVTAVTVSAGGSGYGGVYGAPSVTFVNKPSPAAAPDQTIGYSYWSHKMALPSDLKTALAAGLPVNIAVSFFLSGDGAGGGSDWGAIYAVDLLGDYIAAAQVFTVLSRDGAWQTIHMTDFGLPRATVSLELICQWQTYSGETITRLLALPMVSNYGPTYYDGDFDGWVWDAKANDSPSRESDNTVMLGVLSTLASGIGLTGVADEGLNITRPEKVREALAKGLITGSLAAKWQAYLDRSGVAPPQIFGASPIVCQLYPSDDPGEVVLRLPEQAQTWDWIGTGDGGVVIDYEGSTNMAPQTGLALSIFINPLMGYSLQLKAPASGTTPDPYGLVIDAITVFGAAGCGNADGIPVLDCLRYAAARLGPTSLDFPDASDLRARQLSYPDATTWVDVIGKLDALLDWDYGFRENGVFYYWNSERLAANNRRIYCLPYSQVAADLSVQTEELANGCEVTWTHADGITPGSTGVITKPSPAIPPNLDGSTREKFFHVDAPAGVTAQADAVILAKAYIAEHLLPEVTGSLPLDSTQVVDANGHHHLALSIREGDHIRLMDAPPEERSYGDLVIERVTHDLDTMQTTLEVGVNKKRLDRMLARIDAQVRRL